MSIKKSATGLAASAALALFMSASAAQAGTPPTIIATPNPSVASAAVTLRITNFSPACAGANVEFRDITGGADKTLCGASVDGTGAVTCVTNVLNETGVRTIRAVATIAPCLGTMTLSTSHTVNAAPAAVPTVGEWTLWGLAGLLLIGGGAVASRRFRVARGI